MAEVDDYRPSEVTAAAVLQLLHTITYKEAFSSSPKAREQIFGQDYIYYMVSWRPRGERIEYDDLGLTEQ